MQNKEDKVLSSDTRKEILINLKKRNKTLSELSREIGVSKPAILKHLFLLLSMEAVQRIKNGNRFIYYKITEKGEQMADLIVSVIAALFGSAVVHKLIEIRKEETFELVPARAPEQVPAEAPAKAPKIAEIVTPTPEPVGKYVQPEAAQGFPLEIVFYFILMFLAVFLTIRVLRRKYSS